MIVHVHCESDQGLPGVERITNIEIESDNGHCVNVRSEVFNKLADKEYFTEKDGWRDEVKQDVANMVGCKLAEVEIL